MTKWENKILTGIMEKIIDYKKKKKNIKKEINESRKQSSDNF